MKVLSNCLAESFIPFSSILWIQLRASASCLDEALLCFAVGIAPARSARLKSVWWLLSSKSQ